MVYRHKSVSDHNKTNRTPLTLKYLSLLLLLLLQMALAKAQVSCGIPFPPKNLRPDTITTYSFSEHTVPVSQFPDAEPTSNYSFKTSRFQMTWMPVKTSDINYFIAGSTRYSPGYQSVDTTKLTLWGKEHLAVLLQKKKAYAVFIFQPGLQHQTIYLLKFKGKKNRIPASRYLETYFVR